MSIRVYRHLESLLLMATILTLWAVYYFQYVGGLKPCPLCLAQRFFTFSMGLLCMIGLCLSRRRWARGVAFFQMLFAFVGLLLASRQLWLQSLPADQVPACLPGLDVLVHYFPFRDVMRALFWGTGDCAEVTWRLLGLSMPAWAALYFLIMLLVSGLIFFLLNRSLASLER